MADLMQRALALVAKWRVDVRRLDSASNTVESNTVLMGLRREARSYERCANELEAILQSSDEPSGGEAISESERRDIIRRLNYSMWMQDSRAGVEPPDEWQEGYRCALAAANGERE